MKLPSMIKITLLIAAAISLAASVKPATAQDLFLKDQIGEFGDSPTAQDPVTMTADFKLKTGTRSGVLNVRAQYSIRLGIFLP